MSVSSALWSSTLQPNFSAILLNTPSRTRQIFSVGFAVGVSIQHWKYRRMHWSMVLRARSMPVGSAASTFSFWRSLKTMHLSTTILQHLPYKIYKAVKCKSLCFYSFAEDFLVSTTIYILVNVLYNTHVVKYYTTPTF